MLWLEYLVWYGQFVTNWCVFIEMPFYSTQFSSWHMAKSLVIWQYGYFDSKQIGAVNRGIGGDGVIFLLLLKEIRLQLSHKASQQVLLQNVSHTAETDELSLVLWSTVNQNLRPHGAARTMWVYFALCQQSTLKSQNSVRLVLEVLAKLMVGEKFELGIPQRRGVPYIRGASYIRDKTVCSNINTGTFHTVLCTISVAPKISMT